MKFSIITINYNNLEGLKRTYESVVSQTCQDFEWIIIDGGSTDGSKEFIEEHQAHFAYWCSEPDKGIYNAMNKGTQHVTGDYVIFMNSGDAFYDKEVLRTINDMNPRCDILIGQVRKGDEMLNEPKKIDLKSIDYGFCHQGIFVRAELLRKHPFNEDFKISSDWGFWQQTMIFDRRTIKYVNLIITDFDVSGISSKPENEALMFAEREELYKIVYPPLIFKELRDYQKLQKEYTYKSLMYLKRNYHYVYMFLKKSVSFVYKLIVKLEEVGILKNK